MKLKSGVSIVFLGGYWKNKKGEKILKKSV
jgi:hypothetical protein